MKIVVLEPLGISEDAARSIAGPLTENGHELVIYNDRNDNTETLKNRVKDAEVVVLANMPLSGEVIASDEKLKMISVAFTGTDHIDTKVCKEKNIMVCNAAGYSTSSVAELTFGLIFAVLRNIVPLDRVTREYGTKFGYSQNELYGKTIGIIGTGSIGTKVAEISKAFGCSILAYNRTEREHIKMIGAKYMPLDEVLSQSDIVSIHLPLIEGTKRLIGREKIALMKKSAILINTARGPVVDDEALAEALRDGKIAGAGIDVFEVEPPLSKDYPLLSAPNTVVAPHIGFATEEAIMKRAGITFENIFMWLKGKPQNSVI